MSRIIIAQKPLLEVIDSIFIFLWEPWCLGRLTGKQNYGEMVLAGSRVLREHDRRLLGY